MKQNLATVLVVDDEEFVLKLVGAILTRSGFEVIGALTARAALDAVKLSPGRIGVVLLDVHMPDIDGLSLIPMLRETDPDISVILTSGYLVENGFQRFGRQVSFLQKPYSCNHLTAAVEAALTSS
jgi:DNA-binding NtrC family response regulator